MLMLYCSFLIKIVSRKMLRQFIIKVSVLSYVHLMVYLDIKI